MNFLIGLVIIIGFIILGLRMDQEYERGVIAVALARQEAAQPKGTILLSASCPISARPRNGIA